MISESVVKAIERGAEKTAAAEAAGSDAVVSALESGLSDVVSAVESAANDVAKAIETIEPSSSGSGVTGASFAELTGILADSGGGSGGGGDKSKTITDGSGPSQAMVATSTALLAVWAKIIQKTPALKEKIGKLSKVMGKTAKLIGKAVAPAFGTVLDAVIGVFEWFNSLPGSIRTFLSMAFALVSALTIVATVVSAVVSAIAGLGPVLALLSGPVALAIAAAAALYAAWTTNFLGIKTKTIAVVKFLTGLFKSFAKVVLSVYLSIAKSLMKVWTTAFNLVVGVVRSYLKTVVKTVMRFAQYLTQIWTGVKQMLSGQWKKGLKTMFSATVSYVTDFLKLWGDFASQIVGAIAKLAARGRTEFERLWDLLKAGAKGGANALVSVIESSLNGVLGTIDSFLNHVEKAVNKAVETANKVPGVSFGKVNFGSVGRVSIDGFEEPKSKKAIDSAADRRYQQRAKQIEELRSGFVDSVSKKYLSPDFGEGSETKQQDPSEVLPMLDGTLSKMFGSGSGTAKSPLKGVTADKLLSSVGGLFDGQSGKSESGKAGAKSEQTSQSPPSMGTGETSLPAGSTSNSQKEVNEINIESIDIRTRARAPSTERDTQRLANEIGSEFSDQLGRRS